MRQDGFVAFVAIGVILLLSALAVHQLRHHNEANSDHPRLEAPTGCQGKMSECTAAPIPEPGSLLLGAVGGLVVGYAVRRKETR